MRKLVIVKDDGIITTLEWQDRDPNCMRNALLDKAVRQTIIDYGAIDKITAMRQFRYMLNVKIYPAFINHVCKLFMENYK